MKIRKTRSDKRETYVYHFDDGTSMELKPGVDGVTEADIKRLHALDDAEVYNNIKNMKPPMTEMEKQMKKEWEEAHPGEEYPKKWNLSIDGYFDDMGIELDKTQFAESFATYDEDPMDSVIDDVKAQLSFLTKKQLEVLWLIKVEGYSETEAAEKLGTSIANVCKHLKKAEERISEKK